MELTMLNNTCASTIKFIESKGKTERKRIGQFFTSNSAAEFMGQLFETHKEELRIADFGAGTSILASAVLDHLFPSNSIKSIHLDLFENDGDVIDILRRNIALWKETASSTGIAFSVTIIKENLITYNQYKWQNDSYSGEYDFIISNPPYKKITKESIESRIMDDVVYGQPNYYFLFMAMACKLLKENGEMVFIVPRSWTSGLYFKVFREYFLSNMRIERFHLFISRKRIFEKENVLQETIILKAIKTQRPPDGISISSSESLDDFSTPRILKVPYSFCVGEDSNRFIYLPTSIKEIEVLSMMASFKNTLMTLGFQMKTGPTVDFRALDSISNKPGEDSCPLFWPQNFSSGRIKFPAEDLRGQYISSKQKSLLIQKSNYLFVKRFSSKEEKRRLQPAILLSDSLPDYDWFSAENHINYIKNSHGGLSIDEVYGLYVIFNSSLWDQYYRILNGSTQVNATECNNFPMPDIDTIKQLGVSIRYENQLSTEICDLIIKEMFDDNRRCKNDSVGTGNAQKAAI